MMSNFFKLHSGPFAFLALVAIVIIIIGPQLMAEIENRVLLQPRLVKELPRVVEASRHGSAQNSIFITDKWEYQLDEIKDGSFRLIY